MDRKKIERDEHQASVRAGEDIARQCLLQTNRRKRRKPGVDATDRRAIPAHPVLRGTEDDPLAAQAGTCGQSETGAASDACDGTGGDIPKATAVETRAGAPHLSVPAARAGHRPAESGLGHRHHVYPAQAGVRVPGGDHGLVQPVRPGLGGVEFDGHRILPVGAGLGSEVGATGDLQFGSGGAVHQRGVHPPAGGSPNHDQYGRPGFDNIFIERL